MQPSTTTHAHGRVQLRRPAVLGSASALIAVVLINSTGSINILDWLLVIDGFAAACWWALSRHRLPGALEALSRGALLLAGATFAVYGTQWQLLPWQVLAPSAGWRSTRSAQPLSTTLPGAPSTSARPGVPISFSSIPSAT